MLETAVQEMLLLQGQVNGAQASYVAAFAAWTLLLALAGLFAAAQGLRKRQTERSES